MFQQDLAFIKQLLCCHALHAQAVDGGLPCLQRPSANSSSLGLRSEIMTVLAQHAPCNIQYEALCTSHVVYLSNDVAGYEHAKKLPFRLE